MTIDYQTLRQHAFEDIVHDYTQKDCMLYALGIGLGHDPMDAEQLKFVYEGAPGGLRMLPSMPVVLATPGFWAKESWTGIDWKGILHGEQRLTIHRPLPSSGSLVGKLVIEEIIDKGPGKGALIYSRRDLIERASGELVASIGSTSFCRNDGGFGGPPGPTRDPHPMPDRAPDLRIDLPTLPQAALIYRLSGDYNPLHADPAVAATARFPRPILHGLCTYGVACHALLKGVLAYDASRLRRFDVRFTSPVYPGETIRTEIWREGDGQASFRCRVVERDVVAINNGLARF
ncbi:MAG: MaoC/PaaZ C-terminal domain-containing protein [Burkholderiaceae bacterium]